ncbi:MAG: hypothetical protein EOO06_10430 [Chitinophagaceae bacterium]|nr:MAG: hypothetical protein EOO06_10430 [Chitinophagaceae bacterium]
MELDRKTVLGLASVLWALTCQCQIGVENYRKDSTLYNKKDNKGKQGIWVNTDMISGRAISLETYRNDTLNGYYENYWSNGIISDCGYYKLGQRDSVFFAYWENGNLRGQGAYSEGKLQGEWLVYDSNGKMAESIEYEKGQPVNRIVHNSKFEVHDRIGYDTVVTSFKSDWNKRMEVFDNGLKIKELDFWRNRLLIESTFKNGLIEKRVFYRRKDPTRIEKIYYYSDEKWQKTEFYDSKGGIIKTEFNNN